MPNDAGLCSVDAGENEYSRLVEDLSYSPDDAIHPILRVRVMNIKNGEGYRYRRLLRNIKEVLEKKNYPFPSNVDRPAAWGSTGSGRD